MYSTLLTLAIKARALVNSSLFSSKYFHLYNVKVVPKASSNFSQHHMTLTCLALCIPLIALVTHISALFFKQVPRLALFKILFFPPSHPTGSFVFFNRYGCALSCKCLCHAISFYSCGASEFIILSRAQRADYARIASELRFRIGHKSFYRFGIRSCLATSHKQILKTPFNMTSSCILGFQATRPATSYSSPVYCTLANRKVFLRQITEGCKHNSAQLDKWLEILAVESLTPKER